MLASRQSLLDQRPVAIGAHADHDNVDVGARAQGVGTFERMVDAALVGCELGALRTRVGDADETELVLPRFQGRQMGHNGPARRWRYTENSNAIYS